jgi:hypothetical protein
MVVLSFVALALSGCASPIRVGADYDPATSFDHYKTYGWLTVENDKRPTAPEVDNEILETRVRAAVDRELSAKGFTKQEAEPDAWVTYHAAVRRRIDMNTVRSDYGYGPHRGVSHTWVHQYDEGTLIIDILDGKEKHLIWRGTAQGKVDLFGKPEATIERINAAVKKILAPFPPGKKSP